MSITDNTIILLDTSALLSRDTMYDLIEVSAPEERERLKALLELKARELGCETQFKRVLKSYEKANEENDKDYARAARLRNQTIELERDNSSGKVLNTIENYVRILEQDPKFGGIKYNTLRQAPEVVENGETRSWSNSDDAELRRYVEEKYKLHSEKKSDDALRIIFAERQYHPIRDVVDALIWDHTPRIETFLHKWTKCDDTVYTREVSRLIFAGGIHRLYNAGCKFDLMPVLIGTKQGEGKSTLIRLLAMRDDWFTEVTMFEGDKSVEGLEGAWICEVSELLAMTKTKEQEAVKAFLTRQKDRYRTPYDKRPEDRPRQCIFVGTTNKERFLTDVTGNRRFLPVKVNQSGYDIFDNIDALREDIRQCWAEAKYLFDRGEIPPYLSRELVEMAKGEQQNATEEDYRVGMITDYLRGKTKTCVIDLWTRALDNTYAKPTRKDSNDIVLILQNMDGWQRDRNGSNFPPYGYQQCWSYHPRQN